VYTTHYMSQLRGLNGGTHIDAGDYAWGSIRCPSAAVAGVLSTVTPSFSA